MAFKDLGKLVKLNLANNFLEEICNDTFKGLVSLEDLNLKSNKIDLVSVIVFKECVKLLPKLREFIYVSVYGVNHPVKKMRLLNFFDGNPINLKNIILTRNNDVIFSD